MRTLLISLRSPRAQPRGFRLRIRETAGTCFALKSMLSRRRHRFQIVFAFTCGHQKRFTNGKVWTRINLKTDKYLSVSNLSGYVWTGPKLAILRFRSVWDG